MVLAPKWVSESPRRLIKHRLVDPNSRVSDLVSLGWDLRIPISNTFPGDADAAGLGTTVWEPLLCSLAVTPLNIWQVIHPSSAQCWNPKSSEYWTFFPEGWHGLTWQQIPTCTEVGLRRLSLPLGVTIHTVYCRSISLLDYRGCPTPFWGRGCSVTYPP